LKASFAVLVILLVLQSPVETTMAQSKSSSTIPLPEPDLEGKIPLETTLQQRRSVREFAAEPLTLENLSQLLWATQGITEDDGGRTAPSAGALYPLEIYVVAGNVDGLPPGVYRVYPGKHALRLVSEGDERAELASAALEQTWMAEAPAVFVLAGVSERTTGKYGNRGRQYVHMEVGFAGENLCLQAVALDLGTTVVGAFEDRQVAKVVGLSATEKPLALIPVGHPR
jgi:SagB-type dehydrogenase family enzyme